MPPQLVSRARRIRIGVRGAIIGGLCGLVLVGIVAAQNNGTALVRFLAWSWPGTPLFVPILCALAVGFLVGVLFMLPSSGARVRRSFPAPPPTVAHDAGAVEEGEGPGGHA
jgi:uncharacterized integral membrane protein